MTKSIQDVIKSAIYNLSKNSGIIVVLGPKVNKYLNLPLLNNNEVSRDYNYNQLYLSSSLFLIMQSVLFSLLFRLFVRRNKIIRE